MKKINIVLLIVTAFILSGCGRDNLDRTNPLDPASTSYTGGKAVKGKVLNTSGVVIGGARVYLDSGYTTTDATGYFVFSNLASGTHTLSASASYYLPKSMPINVQSSEFYQDIQLSDKTTIFSDDFNSYGPNVTPTIPPWGSVNANFKTLSGMGISSTTCCTILATASNTASMDSPAFSSTSGTRAKALAKGRFSNCRAFYAETHGFHRYQYFRVRYFCRA